MFLTATDPNVEKYRVVRAEHSVIRGAPVSCADESVKPKPLKRSTEGTWRGFSLSFVTICVRCFGKRLFKCSSGFSSSSSLVFQFLKVCRSQRRRSGVWFVGDGLPVASDLSSCCSGWTFSPPGAPQEPAPQRFLPASGVFLSLAPPISFTLHCDDIIDGSLTNILNI